MFRFTAIYSESNNRGNSNSNAVKKNERSNDRMYVDFLFDFLLKERKIK